MSDTHDMQTPVLLTVYNRPKLTLQLIKVLEEVKPKNVYVFCDGPKNFLDKQRVEEVHQVISKINWDCELKTLYSKKNRGCQESTSKAVDWFFSEVNEGIVLEDDSYPHTDFFSFATTMLHMYKNDKRICQITGYNAGYKSNMVESYFFSSYCSSWGWATWKDRWENYDSFKKNGINLLSDDNVNNFLKNKKVPPGFSKNTMKALNKDLDSWAYIWSMANMLNNQLTIIPRTNLMKNTGFGDDSTHTRFLTSSAYLEVEPMDDILTHPTLVIPNVDFDNFESKQHSKLHLAIDILKTKLLKH